MTGTSVVVQGLRIHLPMQGPRVQSLVQEDLTCFGATKQLVSHNYWAPAPEPMLHNKRSHHKKPAHQGEPMRSNKDPEQPNIKYIIFFKKVHARIKK